MEAAHALSSQTVNTGLTQEARWAAVRTLNRLLADEYVLYTKTRNYHWNVVGPLFPASHRLFESQYEELDRIVDETAERVRALGGWAIGTLVEFGETTRLAEHRAEYPDAQTMISDLLADHETVTRALRQDLEMCAGDHGDQGTANFFAGLLERHEKMAWMLRAIVEGA